MKDIDYQLATKLMNFENGDIIVEDNTIGDFHRCVLHYPDYDGKINHDLDEIWAPTLRIEHAWEVVERLKSRNQSVNWDPPKGIDWHHGWGFELMYQSDENPPVWCASFLREDGCPVEAEADTAEMAICMAALNTLENKS